MQKNNVLIKVENQHKDDITKESALKVLVSTNFINPMEFFRNLKVEYLKTGKPLFDLSMINPDSEPPRILIDRMQESIAQVGLNRYSVARGVGKLRQAFASFYKNKFNVRLCPEKQICITLGAKDAFQVLLHVNCKAGDTILAPSPLYPAFRKSADLLDLKISEYQVSESEVATLENIRSALASSQAKLLLLNFPHNPTGIYYGERFYKELKIILEEHLKTNPLLHICNDLVYGELAYGQKVTSLLEYLSLDKFNVSEIYSLSKAYSIPGWRIAAIAGTDKTIDDIAKYKSDVDFGIYLPLQLAASSILLSNDDHAKKTRSLYSSRLTYLYQVLRKNDWTLDMPKAGCCLWAKMPDDSIYMNDLEVVEHLLNKHGIAALPGSVFGEQYSRYIRLAMVIPEEKLYSLDTQFKIN